MSNPNGYIVSALAESHRIWWHGEGWTHIKSEAQRFTTRDEANAYVRDNREKLERLTLTDHQVEHGANGHSTGKRN